MLALLVVLAIIAISGPEVYAILAVLYLLGALLHPVCGGRKPNEADGGAATQRGPSALGLDPALVEPLAQRLGWLALEGEPHPLAQCVIACV
ncbi:MAG TPA: hypothetical protein VKH20_00080 [Solirubrobacterales bacterium]|nr:hypothetical protein [Solirubrobacterales bacterium]